MRDEVKGGVIQITGLHNSLAGIELACHSWVFVCDEISSVFSARTS